MDWYEAEVRHLEAANRRRSFPDNPVVFYGSSTIRLWQNLKRDLDSPRALNLGFGGSTLAACVHFFNRLVPRISPCSLVIYAGDNDLGDGATPEEVAGAFRALTHKVERTLHGIPMGFISIKPSPARLDILDKIRQTNALVREAVQKRPSSYFIDVFEDMMLADGRPNGDLFTEDGLHMSAAGYKLWTELLSPFRNRMFTEDCSAIQTKSLS